MIEMRKTTMLDVATIKIRDIFEDPNVREDLPSAIERSICVTFHAGGKVLAIVGYSPIHRNAGELWSVTSDDLKGHSIEFHRKCIRALDAFVAANNIKRLQMVVKEGFVQGENWAMSLGFTLEGLMKAYGSDGSNYWLMGRVF